MSSPPPPNIDLYADIKGTIISPVIALMVISAISVALRVVSKLSSNLTLQIDDFFILVALVFAWGTGIASILACYHGIGKHIWNPTVDMGTIVKILWAYEFLYGTVIPLTKLSIIFFYRRLFSVRSFQKFLYLVLFLVVGWWVAIIITVIVQCQPYSYFWEQYTDPTATGTCIDIDAFFVGNGAASVVTDFLILMTPIPMVWGLQMPMMQRLSVLGIFALGGFVCVAGVIRVYVESIMFQSDDLTWMMSQAFIWSSVEPNIGIVCACLPTFRPLVRRFLPTWFASSDKSRTLQHVSGTDPGSRLRSQGGDFYALHDRSKRTRGGDSDDELGLTNDFEAGSHNRRPLHSTEDGILLENTMAITVKRDIDWSETSVV